MNSKTLETPTAATVRRRLNATVRKLKEDSSDLDLTRRAIFDAITTLNSDKALGYLTFNGILDLKLPDGTKIAIIPDWHIPAHDKQVAWMVKEWLGDFQPHIVILIGDAADMFGLSRWPKAPRVVANVQAELSETRRIIDDVVAISNCMHLFYIMGNHEDRNRRTQIDPNASVAGLVDPITHEPILNFHQLMGYTKEDKITLIYGPLEEGGYGGGLLINNDFKFIHGLKIRSKPGQSPYAESQAQGQSVGHGHTHRLGKRVRKSTKHNTLRAYEFGHLADETHAYMAYAVNPNWTHGLGGGIIHGGKLHIQLLALLKIRDENGVTRSAFSFNGKFYQSSSY